MPLSIPSLPLGLGGGSPSLASQVAALMASFAGPAKLWLDPWDITTLQQDSTGTTPVTAAGDPIGRIMDKSGAANHATQATTTSRPLWQTTYAALDGVDDSWATANIDFTSTAQITMVVGTRKLSDAAAGMLFELGASVALAGAFNLRAPRGALAACDVTASANGSTFAVGVLNRVAAPTTAVLTSAIDLSAPAGAEILSRVNGVAQGASTGDAGSGNFGNLPGNIGRRNNVSTPFNGNLYGLIIIGRLLTAPELTLCEQYMAQQAGVVLP